MSREKTTVLYSRNGIRFVKIENIKTIVSQPQFKCGKYEHALGKISPKQKWRDKEKVRYKSKLGFYYFKDEYIDENESDNKRSLIKKYSIQIGSTKYEFEYPIEYINKYDVQKINIDFRPWDILPEYGGMPDNMITALVKEANNFIDICENNGHQIRKEMMIDLFGYEDGPKIQLNNIKILAHGFDTKESFRKRKES